jgi:hypothetical protein
VYGWSECHCCCCTALHNWATYVIHYQLLTNSLSVQLFKYEFDRFDLLRKSSTSKHQNSVITRIFLLLAEWNNFQNNKQDNSSSALFNIDKVTRNSLLSSHSFIHSFIIESSLCWHFSPLCTYVGTRASEKKKRHFLFTSVDIIQPIWAWKSREMCDKPLLLRSREPHAFHWNEVENCGSSDHQFA